MSIAILSDYAGFDAIIFLTVYLWLGVEKPYP
jgi:hypothetical protein